MPLASKAPPTCTPRIVCEWPYARIEDLGSHLDVVLTGNPPLGLRGALAVQGWQKTESGSYRKCNNPTAAFEAQRIVGEFHKAASE